MRIHSGARAFGGALLLLSILNSCTPGALPAAPKPAPRYDATFWETWADGFAEVSIYDLQTPSAGELRDGECILIFNADKAASTVKLNWQRNYQTGIADLSELTSTLLSLATSRVTDASFSRQSWDGHLFFRALHSPTGITITGSEPTQTLDGKPDGLTEEGLIFWARGMAAPFLAPGKSITVSYLASLRGAYDAKQPLVWSRIELTRDTIEEKIETAAGEFEALVYRAELANGKGFRFAVEKAAPHRIVRWQSTSGEVAELYSSERVKYWEMTRPGGEEALRTLGLEPRAPRFVPEEDQ